MFGMPRVTPSKVVTGLLLTIFGFVVYKYVFGVKYEAKYEYSSYYKSLPVSPFLKKITILKRVDYERESVGYMNLNKYLQVLSINIRNKRCLEIFNFC